MVKKAYITNSAKQTRKIAEELAKKLSEPRPGQVSPLAVLTQGERQGSALVLALEGDLGSGKTTFVQGLAKGLQIKENITSPTFVILKKFQVPGSRFHFFYHIDCYRLEKPKELLDLGVEKILLDSQNIVAIEWPEKIKKILPAGFIKIKFEFADNTKRKITMNYDL